MRTPSMFIALSLAGVLAVGCSRPQTRPDLAADETLSRDLDLALRKGGRGAVASQVEMNVPPQPKARASAAPRHSNVAAAIAEERKAPAPETTDVMQHSHVAPAPAGEAVATTAATGSDATSATRSGRSEPEPANEPVRTGRGGGWYPVPTDMGVEPAVGRGPMIILRGGGDGTDDCDERDEHGGQGQPAPQAGGQGNVGGIGGLAGRLGIGGRTGRGGGASINPRGPGPAPSGPVGRKF